jgi:hypothetical protein
MMSRCRSCEATMTPTETVCLACGAPVQVDTRADDYKARFRTGIKYFMFGTAALSLASLFVDTGVPFVVGISVTIVLFLVQNSAQEMLIDADDTKK